MLSISAVKKKSLTEFQKDQIAVLNNHLGNLLAVIHRDGGHYQDEHGTEKAVEDAMMIIPSQRADLETHATSLSAIVKRLEREQTDNARLNTVLAEVAKDYAIDDKMSKKYYAEMIKLRGENKKLQDEIIKIKSTMSNKLINAELDITRLQAERDMLMKNLQYHIDGACQCRACEIAREELKS